MGLDLPLEQIFGVLFTKTILKPTDASVLVRMVISVESDLV
jgi:hypothetical protein